MRDYDNYLGNQGNSTILSKKTFFKKSILFKNVIYLYFIYGNCINCNQSDLMKNRL